MGCSKRDVCVRVEVVDVEWMDGWIYVCMYVCMYVCIYELV